VGVMGIGSDLRKMCLELENAKKKIEAEDLKMFRELLIKLGASEGEVNKAGKDVCCILPNMFKGLEMPHQLKDRLFVSGIDIGKNMFLYRKNPTKDRELPKFDFRRHAEACWQRNTFMHHEVVI